MLFFSSLDWTFGFQSSMRAYSRTLWLLPWGAYYCRLVSYWDLGVGKKRYDSICTVLYGSLNRMVDAFRAHEKFVVIVVTCSLNWNELQVEFPLVSGVRSLAACALRLIVVFFLLNLTPFLTHVHTLHGHSSFFVSPFAVMYHKTIYTLHQEEGHGGGRGRGVVAGVGPLEGKTSGRMKRRV